MIAIRSFVSIILLRLMNGAGFWPAPSSCNKALHGEEGSKVRLQLSP